MTQSRCAESETLANFKMRWRQTGSRNMSAWLIAFSINSLWFSRRRQSAAMSSYDPRIHRELWHNDNPFVFAIRVRQRKCRGCGHRLDERYIIAHEEHREFWKRGCRMITSEMTHYHCKLSCIVPRHPYFTAPPSVACRLIEEQVSRCGNLELSFLSD